MEIAVFSIRRIETRSDRSVWAVEFSRPWSDTYGSSPGQEAGTQRNSEGELDTGRASLLTTPAMATLMEGSKIRGLERTSKAKLSVLGRKPEGPGLEPWFFDSQCSILPPASRRPHKG